MFYSTLDGKYINEGQQFVIDGITYPNVWLNQSTPEQKAALGLEEVIATNQPYNPVYYWTGETLDKATLTYTGAPKELKQVQQDAVAQLNQTAYTILFPTDYMAARAFETGIAMLPQWATWRASIRATASATYTAIQACTNVNEVATIMANITWANDPNTPTPANLMGN